MSMTGRRVIRQNRIRLYRLADYYDNRVALIWGLSKALPASISGCNCHRCGRARPLYQVCYWNGEAGDLLRIGCPKTHCSVSTAD